MKKSPIQIVLRLLSWPFLFIGGIGFGTELVGLISGASFKSLLALGLAIGVFVIGLIFRGLSEISSFNEIGPAIEGFFGGFISAFSSHQTASKMKGNLAPVIEFTDKTGGVVKTNDFLGRIVVIRVWDGSKGEKADTLDRVQWKGLDNIHVVFLYVYIGLEHSRFEEEPLPKWEHAKALLVIDQNRRIRELYGLEPKGPNVTSIIIDDQGIVRGVPKSTYIYSNTPEGKRWDNDYMDPDIVRKYLKYLLKKERKQAQS